MNILKATKKHIPEIAQLFDLYRQFYECEADIDLATKFIRERIENDESIIFIAIEDGLILGFVQLYPSFCSVDAIKIMILHDLYVAVAGRNKGIGKTLMKAASQCAIDQGASRLDLLTALDNKPGQHLYENLGYKKTLEDFYAYSLEVSQES